MLNLTLLSEYISWTALSTKPGILPQTIILRVSVTI